MGRDRRDEFSWRRFALSIARRLGLPRANAPDDRELIEDIDRWSGSVPKSDQTPLSDLLDELEEKAMAVYQRAGLPVQRGHYARPPDTREWQFVAETLSPADRWALVQAYPPEQGWRFATLQTLGHFEPTGDPAVAASDVLSECQALRDTREARHEASMLILERAIRLGMTGADLPHGTGPLRFYPVGPAALSGDGSSPTR